MENLRQFIQVTKRSVDTQAKLLGGMTLSLGIVTSLLGIASPLFLQYTINASATHISRDTYHGILFVVLCVSAEKLFQALSGIGTAMFSQHMNFNLGQAYLKSLIDVPVRQYIRYSPQDVVEILQTARNSNQVILQSITGTMFPILIRFIAACCVLIISRDWMIVLFVLIYTTIYGICSTRITSQLTSLFSEALTSSMRASRFLGDIAANVTVVKIFDAWTAIQEKYNTEQRHLLGRWTAYFTKSAKLDLLRATSFSLLLSACLLKSLWDIKNGTSNLGHFILINAYIIQICGPIDIMIKTTSGAIEALSGFSPFFKFIQTKRNATPRTDKPQTCQPATTSIEFKGVGFDYGDHEPVLVNTSFKIFGGRMFALTGPTGAGKSTIVKLLLGLESAQAGHILINGLDITLYSEAELYSLITVVPQETYIFNDTLAFNLRVGKPDASDEELADVIEAVQLTDLATKLPDGIYSAVGDRGLALSGGERQRIALARAILRGAKILVMDEGTSALDEETEAKVLQAMRPIPQNKIVITVAHRATAIAAADDVLVIQDGEASPAEQPLEKMPTV